MRSKSKYIEIEVEKKDTVKDIKVEIMKSWGISPIAQRLFFNKRELATDETVDNMKILPGDEIHVEEIEETVDFPTANGRVEGFGGTALLGMDGPCESISYRRSVS